jgi:transposase
MSVVRWSVLWDCNSLIYRWIYKYSTYNEKKIRIVEMKDSQTNRVKELEEKVKELERSRWPEADHD